MLSGRFLRVHGFSVYAYGLGFGTFQEAQDLGFVEEGLIHKGELPDHCSVKLVGASIRHPWVLEGLSWTSPGC
jgi:hypothetical protein